MARFEFRERPFLPTYEGIEWINHPNVQERLGDVAFTGLVFIAEEDGGIELEVNQETCDVWYNALDDSMDCVSLYEAKTMLMRWWFRGSDEQQFLNIARTVKHFSEQHMTPYPDQRIVKTYFELQGRELEENDFLPDDWQ